MAKQYIDITNFDSTGPEYLMQDRPAARIHDDPERWYRERMKLYAKDYSKPWFDAARWAAILAVALTVLDVIINIAK